MVACDAIPQLPQQTSNNGDASIVAQAGNTPEATVANFLAAWTGEQFETMYALLHPRSLQVYPLEEFVDLYETTHADIGFTNVTYQIDSVEIQGTSAAINYDAVINTASFGDIEDSNRTMRLVENNGRWTVAWSPMDVINGMTSNVHLAVKQAQPKQQAIRMRGMWLMPLRIIHKLPLRLLYPIHAMARKSAHLLHVVF